MKRVITNLLDKCLVYLLSLRCSMTASTKLVLGTAKLRNGQTCVLRYLVPKDAAILCELMFQVSHETNFNIHNSASSVLDMSVGEQAIRLARSITDTNAAILGAFLEPEKLVGIAEFGECQGHVQAENSERAAMLGLSVLQDFWGLGIGSMLLKLVIDLARNCDFKFLELEVHADNQQAIALYKKFGFNFATISCDSHDKQLHTRLAL